MALHFILPSWTAKKSGYYFLTFKGHQFCCLLNPKFKKMSGFVVTFYLCIFYYIYTILILVLVTAYMINRIILAVIIILFLLNLLRNEHIFRMSTKLVRFDYSMVKYFLEYWSIWVLKYRRIVEQLNKLPLAYWI